MKASPRIEIHLIGPLRVVIDGQEVALPRSRKTRALLTMLALEPGDHPRPVLCSHLWPDSADARAGLRWSLSRLRQVLGGEVIVSSPRGVRLDTTQAITDVVRLEALLQQDAAGALSVLREHEGRFSSTPLPDLDANIGVEFELWLESCRQGLRRLQQRLVGVLVAALADQPEQALELARRRVALDSLNEDAIADLLRLTWQVAGRQRAQAALEQARQRLKAAGLPDAGLLAAWRRLGEPASVPPAGIAPAVTSAPDDPEPVRAPPQKPSLAVLGFRDLSGGASALLAEGLSVDLTSSLARLRQLFVIARGSAARFRLGELSAERIGEALGVRYLIHGTTRRADARLKVTVDLIACESNEVIWSERFERALDDLFLVQQEIVDLAVAALLPQIELAERERARLLPTADLGAWECFHRAMWHTYRFTRADTEAAHALLQQALERDPRFARAHAGLSFNHFSRAFLNASEDPERDIQRALASARESVGLEPRDAFGYWSLGRALFLAGEHDQALTAIDRALAINQSYAQGHYARGFIGCHAGLSREVYGDLAMAQRLSPFDPLVFAMESCRAISLAVTDRPKEAAGWAVRATQEPNAHFHIFAIAAACLQLAGRADEAASNVREVLARHPPYSLAVYQRSFPHKLERDRRLMGEALLAAGLPR